MKKQSFSSSSRDNYGSGVGSSPNIPHAQHGHGCQGRTVLFSGLGYQTRGWLLAIKYAAVRLLFSAHHLVPVMLFHVISHSCHVCIFRPHHVMCSLSFTSLSSTSSSHFPSVCIPPKYSVLSHLFSFRYWRYIPKSLLNDLIICSQMLSWSSALPHCPRKSHRTRCLQWAPLLPH